MISLLYTFLDLLTLPRSVPPDETEMLRSDSGDDHLIRPSNGSHIL